MSTSYKKSWVFCWSGALSAIDRVDVALGARETDAKVLQPLAEALWWICAADESLMEEYNVQWKQTLRPTLTHLDDLKGLRWARNRITHQICHWEIATPPFCWADAEIVAPQATVPMNKDHGRAEYKANLEGNDAREAIRRVANNIRNEALGKLPP